MEILKDEKSKKKKKSTGKLYIYIKLLVINGLNISIRR